MRFLLRVVGALVLLLSTAVFVGCIAGAVGAWMFRQRATEKVQDLSARLDVGLQRVSDVADKIQRALEKARAEVSKVNKSSADLSGGAVQSRMATGILRGLVETEVGPSINDINGRLAVVADAGVAISSLLQSLQEFQLGQGRINPDKLERASDQAAQLSTNLRRLQGVIGDGDRAAEQREVAAAAGKVDGVLQECQEMVGDWQSDLNDVHAKMPQLKTEVLGWLTLSAIVVTAVCAWVALSQISLFVHAWKWCWGA
jgi:hypothetical protein